MRVTKTRTREVVARESLDAGFKFGVGTGDDSLNDPICAWGAGAVIT